MELDEVIRLERYKNEMLRQIRFMEDEITDLKDSVETIDSKLKDIIFEIIGADGKVHYRRPYGEDKNKLVIEAMTTKGVTVRVVTGEQQDGE